MQLGTDERRKIMGVYLKPGNAGFQSVRKGLYVDKTGLIIVINDVLGTKDKLVCVSRPGRFRKSFVAQMLCAYYDNSCDSRELFKGLEIEKTGSFELHLNQYNVISLDITWFITTADTIKHMVRHLQDKLLEDTLAMKNEEVAAAIEDVHSAGTAPLFYNNEQALRSVIK